MVPSEPPSYDAHREETFGVMHPMAPHYNTLLRVDPFDKTGTKPVGDLAESWTIAKDGMVYTFKLRQGVKFHDGTLMTSRDVKASYDKIIFPPQGIASSRKSAYRAVEVVEAPDAQTVRFRLKWPESSFLLNVASPWNWIYKADILAKDMRWYETHVMGTGPFLFVEHVKGSHWVGKKNPDYWDKGKPYLDGYRATFVSSSSAQVAAVRGERAHIQFRGFAPADRDSLVAALGNKITVQESPWDCILMVAMNHARSPSTTSGYAAPSRSRWTATRDRRRSPRSPSSRKWRGSRCRERRGRRRPTSSPSSQAMGETSRPRGRKPSGSSRRRAPRGCRSRSRTAASRSPTSPPASGSSTSGARWGLAVKQEVVEPSTYYSMLRSGDFEAAMDFQCGFIVEPDLDLPRFLSDSDANYGKSNDKVLDDLFAKQVRATDPEERKKTLRAFEKRLLDEEVHTIMTLQWHRIIPHSSKVKGWTITPSHYLNNMLDTVWLSE